ncbi:MAG: hypothetical protein E6K19_03080 [Methanobacteriota archaeon]|nr:MAG: hypothetical protein E6K19_03080 [Euryarchaeota archaeon]
MIRRSIIYFVSAVLFWLTAMMGVLSDVDHFTLEDLRDRTQLHHEHIVVLAAFLGLLMLIAAGVAFGRELRIYTPPAYEADARERV